MKLFLDATGNVFNPGYGYAVNTLDEPSPFVTGTTLESAINLAAQVYPRHTGVFRIDNTEEGYNVQPAEYVEPIAVATLMALVRNLTTFWDFASVKDVTR